MPMPAAPEPTSTRRCADSLAPLGRSAARTPPQTTAAVPWMSSLKHGTVAVAVEQPDGVVLLEVLPLQEGLRVHLLHGDDERLDEGVVGLAPQAAASDSRGREGRAAAPRCRSRSRAKPAACVSGGAGAGRVERELADRDAHAERPLVAEPEDPLTVGRHDESHAGQGGVGEQLRDAVDVVRCDPHAAGPSHHVAVFARACPTVGV